ncbi:MAG: MotA/TolQ/ExbB proton channel family protein, partial [Pseudomonas sp.]
MVNASGTAFLARSAALEPITERYEGPTGCDITVFGASTPYVRVAHFFEGTVTVWELVKSGGWMMLPIILSS